MNDLKLRNDLVLSRNETPQGTTCVVKDPATGRFFRFKDTEAFILEQLDGKSSTERIQEKVETRFEASLPRETLEQFFEQLRRAGLIENQQQDGTVPQRRRSRRIQGNIFFLRIKAFDPDRLFDHLSPKIDFFFTRTFLSVSAFCILSGIVITISDWPEIQRSFQELFRTLSLTFAWFVVLSVVTLHEFSHGLACKRFGGHVHEIGFLLIFFMPAFYCNVSDAWLFPERSKRLWVTFAGAYFEIFLWSLSTLFWRLTEGGNALHSAALIIMATSGVKTLFNLNPLIKLDGYYLLSDYLEIPNLRSQAFRYIRERVAHFLSSAAAWVDTITPRERRIYVLYGIFSGCYSFWLISMFTLNFGEYLMNQYGGWGFLAFSFFLTGILLNPLRRLFQTPLALARTGIEKLSFLGKPIKILGSFGVLAALLFLVRMDLTVSGEFVLLPARNADIRAEVDEIITEVFVAEGDTVRRGDPIVQLSERTLSAELQKINAEMDETQAKLKLLKAGPRSEEISLAKTLVAKAQERLLFSQKEMERTKALFERQLLSQKEYEQGEEVVAVRERELQEEQTKLNALLAGSRPEEIQALESSFNRLKAEQQFLKGQIDLLVVKSPVTGVVVTHKPIEKLGEYVEKGDLIAKVHELETATVEIPVSEKDIGVIQLGQEVVVKARAFPDRSFYGSVVSIAPIAAKTNEWETDRKILVTARLTTDAYLLKSGMSGTAKIYCGEQPLVNLLLRGIMRFVRVEVWSWF